MGIGTRLIVGSLALILCLSLANSRPRAAVFHVRQDGGTSSECTGLTDGPYPGSGEGQPCAWSHPFWALEPGEPPAWKISGGDTLIIHPGS